MKDFSRRAFLQAGAATTAATLLPKPIFLDAHPLPRPQNVAPSDRVRFGIIGIGMQGSGLLAGAITLPGVECVAAAQKPNRIVQIGSQRVSSALCAKAREIYRDGAIGEVAMVELTLGRNDPTGAWEYPPPTDLSPQTLDWDTWLNDAPKIPFNQLHFARWRCWRAYGTGVAGDLMVHLISGMLYTLGWNEVPRSATAMGGIFRFKDRRDMPDFHTVLFDHT